LIVVDLPPEESEELDGPARAAGLDMIRLVAPTTGPDRLPFVLAGAGGFVYYVSITGITGTRTATEAHLAEAIPRLRAATALPVAVGFGVRTPDQAATVVRYADAAVVASALIDTIAERLDADGRPRPGAVEAVLDQVRALAQAVRTARTPAAA
ncbi:MAG: tryptophan synthase subunit alpha, partial [Elioraea sp.]|nr:tryptophan synthase subunit alpha [Elioraea sp.]